MRKLLMLIKTVVLQNLRKFLLSFLMYLEVKESRLLSTEYANRISRAEIFPSNRHSEIYDLSEKWFECYRRDSQGDFVGAATTRKEVLSRLYIQNGLSDDYFPPILSEQFFGPFGHLAVVGIHIAAQRLGILPHTPRIGLIPKTFGTNPILELYRNEITFINYHEGRGWTELPKNWHATERPEMFRGFGEFIEPYELVERVFKDHEVSQYNPFFESPNLYINKSLDQLKQFGFTGEDWFVGLHIRDGSKTKSLRNQDINNYLPAIKEITKRGGWVLRIGGAEMPALPPQERVIDLVVQPDAAKDLHLFVLSKCIFFIGTCSGPQYYPSLFGVPTLFTNQIGPGRSTLTFAKNSIHLPKTYLDSDGKYPSFFEMLKSPFGYGELSLKEYSKLGIHVVENTSDEIRDATIEMFDRISGVNIPNDREFDTKIASIRSQMPWASAGRFANSYLTKHEKTFLN